MKTSPRREPAIPPRSSSDGSCDHDEAAPREACGLRCDCGCLLARYVPGGVELKCRRCKRTVVVQPEGEPRLGRTG